MLTSYDFEARQNRISDKVDELNRLRSLSCKILSFVRRFQELSENVSQSNVQVALILCFDPPGGYRTHTETETARELFEFFQELCYFHLNEEKITSVLTFDDVCMNFIIIAQQLNFLSDKAKTGTLKRDDFENSSAIISKGFEVISQHPLYYERNWRKFCKWEHYLIEKAKPLVRAYSYYGWIFFRRILGKGSTLTKEDFKDLVCHFNLFEGDLVSFLYWVKSVDEKKRNMILKLFKREKCLYNVLYPELIVVGIFSVIGLLAFVTPALVIRQTILHISNILLITSGCFVVTAALACLIVFGCYVKNYCAMLDKHLNEINIDEVGELVKSRPIEMFRYSYRESRDYEL